MQNLYDYKKHALLYVDDEEMSLKNFARAYSSQFRILTAPSAQEGLKVFEANKDDIGLLMTDQRMPGEKGVWLLERVRQVRPRIVRILATAYADMEAAIDAVNSGSIYKYVTKPWDPPQLEQTLKRGLEFFMIQRERDQLLHEKMSVLHNMMIADRIVSMGLLAAGLSHHIRNSLVAVKTFLDLAPAKMAEEKVAASGMRDPDFWKEYYSNVQLQVEKINNLLKDLWSASETPSFQFGDKVFLHEVVAHTLEMFKKELEARKLKVENRIPNTLPVMQVDKPKFYRLFELLLKDEIASLPVGSNLTLDAEHIDGGAKAEIKVRIRDNGPGLPQEALRVLFDPFVIRSDTPAEYGIHLMACFFIVYHHSGRIEATSKDGYGTTFTLHLPLHPERAPLMTDDHNFLHRALLNEKVWEQLIASA
jgi:two-component system probable response regulator PhcQ